MKCGRLTEYFSSVEQACDEQMLAINGIVWQAHAGKVSLLSIPSGMQTPGVVNVVNASGRQLLLLTG